MSDIPTRKKIKKKTSQLEEGLAKERKIEQQKNRRIKARRQEGQRARMPVDQKTSLLEGYMAKNRWQENQMARTLDRQKCRQWMARQLEEQMARRLEDNTRHHFNQLNMDYQ